MEERRRPNILYFIGALIVGVLVVWIAGNVIANDDDGADGDSVQTEEVEDDFAPEQPAGGADVEANEESCDQTQAISWNEAVEHVGNEVALIGPVLEVEEASEGASLVVGTESQDSHTVEIVLTETAEQDFEAPVTELFNEVEVCVVGVLQSVEGDFQMVVNESSDIRVL